MLDIRKQALKVCICDIDGVIADSSSRFAKAEEAKQQHLRENSDDERGAISIFWKFAFTSELVPLDTLIDGATEAIRRLEGAGYTVIFLTSRPESMLEATLSWLDHVANVYYVPPGYFAERLIMKSLSKQFTKTTVWKAEKIMELVACFRPEIVLVVDDEENNLAEIEKHQAALQTLLLAKSLKEALALC